MQECAGVQVRPNGRAREVLLVENHSLFAQASWAY